MVEKEVKEIEHNIRCSQNFFKIVQDYQERFYAKHKVKASIPEVTEIIAVKIEKIGGLIV